MTGSNRQSHLPGRLLLKAARLFFDESVVAAVILPAVADLQHEVAAAGSDRRRRGLAMWRGYRACWTAVMVAPFTHARSPYTGDADLKSARVFQILLALLLVSVGITFSWIAFAVPGAAAVFAVAIHLWRRRHPSHPGEALIVTRWPRAEINYASIPVADNVGGAILVVGSCSMLLVAVPQTRWFLVASMTAGVAMAAMLRAWRTQHPASATFSSLRIARR